MSVVPSSRRLAKAFTLLEIMMCLFLVVMLLSISLPSLSGQLSRQKLQGAFDRFDALVADAQKRSVSEGQAYSLVWTRDGSIRLYPAAWSPPERKKAGSVAALIPGAGSSKNAEHYTLVRGASLTSQPGGVWTFWPSGNCEPVGVRYEGPAGTWEAAYNPLSGRGTLNRFLAR